MEKITVKQAIDRLREAVDEDNYYFYSWFANISTAIKDAGGNEKIAEEASNTFLLKLFGKTFKGLK